MVIVRILVGYVPFLHPSIAYMFNSNVMFCKWNAYCRILTNSFQEGNYGLATTE